MNYHDSDDDFIDDLYKQSANETPPAHLDKQILSLAKQAHQPNQFTKMMSFQRVLSVAAVMVLSITIFFEVDHEPTRFLEQDTVTPQQSILQSPPSAPTSEHINPPFELKESFQQFEQDNAKQESTRQLKLKAMKKTLEKEHDGIMANEIGELTAEEQRVDDARPQSASLPEKSLKLERPNKDQNPDIMLQEIGALFASGKENEARIMYEQFKQLYPEYAVPELIREKIGKDE